RRRAASDRGGEGRRDGQDVVAASGGEADLHPAAGGGDSALRPQPPHPSPRSLVRLSPPERHPGSWNVRPVVRCIGCWGKRGHLDDRAPPPLLLHTVERLRMAKKHESPRSSLWLW